MSTAFSDKNNFDLLRLFAALQVVVSHIYLHLDLNFPLFFGILSMFPGVPIFFFISGFLITLSLKKIYARNSGLVEFYTNRFLRLYPALIACFFISIIAVYLSGYFSENTPPTSGFLGWMAAQLTFFQFYNPDFMRGYGIGVLNGNLWTISVELQFYILTPLVLMLFKKSREFILVVLLFFVAANLLYSTEDTFFSKLYRVSFAPWFYMFLLGGIASCKNDINKTIKKIPFIPILLVYTLLFYLSTYYAAEKLYGFGSGYKTSPLLYLFLCLLLLKAAFSLPNLSEKILRKNDYSYGIYIYHIPTLNLFLYLGYNSALFMVLAFLLTFFMAILSWHFIEKPCLRLKKVSLRQGAYKD